MDHLQRYAKLAFRANAPISTERIIRVANDEQCTDVFLVGDNLERLAKLQDAGFRVHVVETAEKLPADVFLWFQHEGFWAATRVDNGAVRDVGYAEDSLMATRVLLNRFAPDVRKQFQVRPAAIEVIDVSF